MRNLSQIGAFGANVLVIAALAGCGPLQQRYAGPITVTQGDCGTAFHSGTTAADLSVRGKEALFAPNEGVVVLSGNVNDAGHVATQSNAPGADKKPFLQVFEGDVHGDHVTGVFATPRCRATVDLKRY
jgi:hypothetical protein